MKVALCCIGKMENRYVREFVEWYKNIGVDNIFIYDNNDKDGERFEEVIGDYVKDGFVKIKDVRGKKAPQCDSYNAFYKEHGGEYDWIMYFDVDEFLVLNKDKSIKDYLGRDMFNGYECVCVNWKLYGDNDMLHYDNRPLMKRFTKPLDADKHVDYKFPENNHLKSIVRGSLKKMEYTVVPHIPSNNLKMCLNNGKPLKTPYRKPFAPYNWEFAELRHYRTKTIEEFAQIRAVRGRATIANVKYKVDQFKRHNKWTPDKQKIWEKYFPPTAKDKTKKAVKASVKVNVKKKINHSPGFKF